MNSNVGYFFDDPAHLIAAQINPTNLAWDFLFCRELVDVPQFGSIRIFLIDYDFPRYPAQKHSGCFSDARFDKINIINRIGIRYVMYDLQAINT